MILNVIIVNYNGAQFIKSCFDSIVSQFRFFPDFSILVIDNASTDESLKLLADYEDRITLIKNNVNVGFAMAHNQVIHLLDTPYIWLLNNDTKFDPNIDIITPIIAYLNANPDVVGLSPKLLNTDGTLQYQGSGLNRYKFRSKKITQVSFLSGASLFIRTQFFKDMNGFDPHLFFYNDDVDFAMQAKKLGKRLIYYPSLEITHHGGLSTKFEPIKTTIGGYYGSIYLCKKYYPKPVFLMYYHLVRLLINLKTLYHTLIATPLSDEWVIELNKLKNKLNHEI